MSKGRKPDWRFRVLNKETDERGALGAGWSNPDGSITVKLDPCVVMAQEPNLLFTLFPEQKREPPEAGDTPF